MLVRNWYQKGSIHQVTVENKHSFSVMYGWATHLSGQLFSCCLPLMQILRALLMDVSYKVHFTLVLQRLLVRKKCKHGILSNKWYV
jgi:hypothetical protein